MPPEVVVLPFKRFWSGAITEAGVLKTVERYRPEQLLLSKSNELNHRAWRNWVANHYILVAQDAVDQLWVVRALNPEPLVGPNEQLRRLCL